MAEEAEFGLVVPFIACVSKGGPFDDKTFVAGFQAGQVYAKLHAARAADATEVVVCVNHLLVDQLELVGMDAGFPVMVAEPWPEAPEWVYLTFRTSVTGSDHSAVDHG